MQSEIVQIMIFWRHNKLTDNASEEKDAEKVPDDRKQIPSDVTLTKNGRKDKDVVEAAYDGKQAPSDVTMNLPTIVAKTKTPIR